MYSVELKKVVAELMFAYGDAENPCEESVECVCGLLTTFLDDICARASEFAKYKKGALDMECFMLVVKDNLLFTNAARSVVARTKAIEEETVNVIP